MELPEQPDLQLQQLPTASLRALAAASGLSTQQARSELLSALTHHFKTLPGPNNWILQSAQGKAPGRCKGILVEYGGALYLYGGLPQTTFLPQEPGFPRHTYPTGENVMMKFSGGIWSSVEASGDVPVVSVQTGYSGVLYDEKLWIWGTICHSPVGAGVAAERNSLYSFDFKTRVWAWEIQVNTPSVRRYHKAAIYKDQMLAFGGETQPYVSINSSDVLWAFDFPTHEWSLMQTWGDPPNPKHIDHFCIYGDAAFVITNAPIPVPGGRRAVYRLDLATSVWQRLPDRGAVPSCRKGSTATVLGRQWLLIGGWGGETFNDFYALDLETGVWTAERCSRGREPAPRYNHQATVLGGRLVLVGGLVYNPPHQIEAAEEVQLIWQEPCSRQHDAAGDMYVENLELPAKLQELYCSDNSLCDCVIEVGGDEQEPEPVRISVHRLVLAANSPVFHRMLSANMSEGREKVVVIRDMSVETVQLLLQFMYGKSTDSLSPEEAFLLLPAADKYAVENLKWQCAQVLVGAIDVGTVFQIAHLAYMHDETRLLHACVKFMVTVHELGSMLGGDTCSDLLEGPQGQPVAPWFSKMVFAQIHRSREE